MSNLARAVVLLVLGVISIAARAEWMEIPLPDEDKRLVPKENRLFINMSSLQRQGDIVEIAFLYDLSEADYWRFRTPGFMGVRQTVSYKSKLVEARFNCQTAEHQTVHFTFYSENMGRGTGYTQVGGPTIWLSNTKKQQSWRDVYAIVCKH